MDTDTDAKAGVVAVGANTGAAVSKAKVSNSGSGSGPPHTTRTISSTCSSSSVDGSLVGSSEAMGPLTPPPPPPSTLNRFGAKLSSWCHRTGVWCHGHEPEEEGGAGTWCGSRHGKEWGKLLGFYLVFHGVLTVGVFAICYGVMFAVLPPTAEGPRREAIDPSLVAAPANLVFTSGDVDTLIPLIAEAGTFLAQPTLATPLDPFVYGDCAVSPYGYDESGGKPCVYLKLNRVFDYIPPPNASVNCR